MVEKFLGILKKHNYEIFPTEKFSIDYREREEYQDAGEVFCENSILETDRSGKIRNIKNIAYCGKSLFKYFLDGSRKVYKIAEINLNNRYLPLLCAQVGVACSQRSDKVIKKFELVKNNCLLVPDCINKMDLDTIKNELEGRVVKLIKIDKILEYEYSKKMDKEPIDLANAKVIKEMQGLEVRMIESMTKSNKLGTDCMLIIDGSLQISDRRVNEENFRNVIGLSKSFNIHLTEILKLKSQEIGTLLVKLKYGERTPVFQRQHENVVIGAWYLRIRDEKKMKNPLDGIIKVEKIANRKDNEHIKGFDSDEIDTLSRCLLSERNVSCFGKDKRWANHIYPIYLTEQLIKSSFISDLYFINVF